MPELLLELLSEEIPARMQARAAEDLKRLVCDGLKDAGLTFERAEAYATPRRLALVVDGIPETQPDVSEEKRGPQVGAPEQAINGFLGSLDGMAMDDCEQREVKGKTYYFAVIEKKGSKSSEVLSGVMQATFTELSWPKSMRWADIPGVRWVRPISSILCIFDSEVVPCAIGPYGSDDVSSGHRFLAPDPIQVSDFADYEKKLHDAKVILDPAERRAVIEADAKRLCEEAGLVLKDAPGLLDEVAGLVEWPVVHMGIIDAEFMDLPPEVLSTAMRSHQKYFSVLDKDGNLADRFIFAANTETTDGGKQVIAGNERVLRARLADAKFFWDQDCKHSLESRIDGLKDRVFHAKLGSVFDKVERVEKLAGDLAEACGADKADAMRAARLAKADLSTGMVGEFPELQGIMGRYYALADGDKPEVAVAIAEHYAPQGPGDACPSKPVSVAVALADKIDSLVSFFAIDEKPTGSKDPFALRRAALGVVRLILENKLRLPLKSYFGPLFSKKPAGAVELNEAFDEFVKTAELLKFFADRLKVHLKEKGIRHDHIDAVLSLSTEDDLVRLLARVDALSEFLATDDGENLLTAYRRAANIVQIEERKDKDQYHEVKTDLFKDEEENDLWQNLHAVQDSFTVSMESELFVEAMAGLAQLRSPIDKFFDNVTVNIEDDSERRANRLALLRSIKTVMNQVADFSKIEG